MIALAIDAYAETLPDDGHYDGPIRSLPECAAIMRGRGDTTMTPGTAWHIEQRAIRKLRTLLENMEDDNP